MRGKHVLNKEPRYTVSTSHMWSKSTYLSQRHSLEHTRLNASKYIWYQFSLLCAQRNTSSACEGRILSGIQFDTSWNWFIKNISSSTSKYVFFSISVPELRMKWKTSFEMKIPTKTCTERNIVIIGVWIENIKNAKSYEKIPLSHPIQAPI